MRKGLHPLRTLALLPVAALAGLLAMQYCTAKTDHSERVKPPLSDSDMSPPTPGSTVQDYTYEVKRGIVYARVGSRKLALDLYVPSHQSGAGGIEQMPACILFIHGGAWRYGSRGQGAEICEYFAGKGFLCASCDYRLTDEASWPAQIHDCKAAVRWLRKHAAEYGGDGSRLGVMGTSAGGHLAAMLGVSGEDPDLEGALGPVGVSSQVDAVCDWFGPADIVGFSGAVGDGGEAVAMLLGGTPASRPEVAASASPVCHVDASDAEFLIIHGTDDKTVPFGQSESLLRRLREAGVEAELVAVPGGGHGQFVGTTPDVDELLRLTAEFFRRHL